MKLPGSIQALYKLKTRDPVVKSRHLWFTYGFISMAAWHHTALSVTAAFLSNGEMDLFHFRLKATCGGESSSVAFGVVWGGVSRYSHCQDTPYVLFRLTE